MRIKIVVSMLIPFLLLSVGLALGGKKKGETSPRLLSHLPKDPLLATVVDVGNLDEKLDELLGLLEGFDLDVDREEIDAKLAEFDERLGCSVRRDLLGASGPEVGFVLDLPPIDELMAAMSVPQQAIAKGLAGVAYLAQVREPETIDACLRKLLALAEATLVEEQELVKVQIELDDDGSPPLELYYGFGEGSFAMGASSDFVRASLRPRDDGQRLTDGEDFSRIYPHLDRNAEDLTYVNLPKVAEMVRSSATLQAILGSEPDSKQVVDFFLNSELASAGIGSTSVKVEGGRRTTTFAPPMLSSGAFMPGIIAAIAIPNFLNAVDRGKQKRTMADLRSVATACESFSIDNNKYPGPTDGWVPVGQIADSLEPTYIRVLPRTDAWGHPFMFWSDTEGYRIFSPGKDGEQDGDWSGEIEPRGTQSFAGDIVFVDGSFAVWPEGAQE